MDQKEVCELVAELLDYLGQIDDYQSFCYLSDKATAFLARYGFNEFGEPLTGKPLTNAKP